MCAMKRALATLSDWTYETIADLVDKGCFETDTWEWKELLTNRHDSEHHFKLCKAACSFANSSGGFIIFGVKDSKSAAKGGSRISGIQNTGELSREFNDQIGHCEPSIDYDVGNPPIGLPGCQKVLLVVHVPKSIRGLHGCKHEDEVHFYKRAQGTAQHMTYREIVEAISRLEGQRVRLRRLCRELQFNATKLNSIVGTTDEGLVSARDDLPPWNSITWDWSPPW